MALLKAAVRPARSDPTLAALHDFAYDRLISKTARAISKINLIITPVSPETGAGKTSSQMTDAAMSRRRLRLHARRSHTEMPGDTPGAAARLPSPDGAPVCPAAHKRCFLVAQFIANAQHFRALPAMIDEQRA